jgi:phosphoglycolate phosphatase
VRAVLLWDIDGTLLTTGRAGVFAVQEAVTAVVGITCNVHGLHTAGLTDYEVMELALRTAGASTPPATVSAALAEYERRLPPALHRRIGRVFPGVREILEDTASRGDILSLLLTGNTRAGAAAKLAHYGLDGYFRDGAFCTGPGSRDKIARNALAIAERTLAGVTSPESVVVVGDTPADVRCGHAIDARTVAVATGSYSAAELASHGAWVVYDELPRPAEFWSIVLGNTARATRRAARLRRA